MAFCFELNTDFFGHPIRNMVNIAFFHFLIHGIFVTAFVFSNTSYPPFYYVDYLYGISGCTLVPITIIGYILADMKKYQPMRSIWATVIVLNVLTVIVASLYYTIERWNDVITTAIVRAIRRPMDRDLPDHFWCAVTVIACIMLIPFLFYLIYITSYMCNKWKSRLFSYQYDAPPILYPLTAPYYGGYPTQITVPQVPQSNAYPVQRNE